MWELDYKQSWGPKNWCFQRRYWRRLLRFSWTTRRFNQSILKEISPDYSLEGLILKLKLQYFDYLMQRTDSLEKTDAGKDWRHEKGTTEDEMVGWHHRLNGHEFEQPPEDGEGQGSLACCNPDMTEQMNWTELNHHKHLLYAAPFIPIPPSSLILHKENNIIEYIFCDLWD